MDGLVRDEPDRADYLQHQAKGLSVLGNVQGAAGRSAEALETHGRALAIRERLVRSTDDPRLPDYQADLRSPYYNLGYLKGQALDAPNRRETGPRGPDSTSARRALPDAAEILREPLQVQQGGRAPARPALSGARRDRQPAAPARASRRRPAGAGGGGDPGSPRRLRAAQGPVPGRHRVRRAVRGLLPEPRGHRLPRKQPGEAFAWFGKAEGEYQRLLTSDPKNPRLLQMLGYQAFSVGNLLVGLDGPKSEARRYLEKAKGIQAALVDGSPGNRVYQRQLKMTTDLLQRLR